MKRKAVIIWGYSNSGKTTTIKHLVGVKKRLCNCVFTISNMNGDEVKVFVEGQSPSEKNKTMEDLLLERYTEESLPANIIVAEQLDGKNAGNTIDYLIKNKYNLAFFVIQNPAQFNKTHWDYNLNSEPSISDLDKRAEDIRAIF